MIRFICAITFIGLAANSAFAQVRVVPPTPAETIAPAPVPGLPAHPSQRATPHYETSPALQPQADQYDNSAPANQYESTPSYSSPAPVYQSSPEIYGSANIPKNRSSYTTPALTNTFIGKSYSTFGGPATSYMGDHSHYYMGGASSAGLHARHPYYSYRHSWFTPGPASQNVTIVW